MLLAGGAKSMTNFSSGIYLSMPVLVVDDSATTLRILQNLLAQLGFKNIDAASDGAEALTKLRGRRYDLVISDWNMDPMSGYDFLCEVRADPSLKQLRFIMITADPKADNLKAAKDAGVNTYLIKPFDAHQLKTKIQTAFTEKPNLPRPFQAC